MKCHYEVLELSTDADDRRIKSAYQKLALKWHPDKNLDNPDFAKEQFQVIHKAYEVLSDNLDRAWYDAHRDQVLQEANSKVRDNSLNVSQFFTTTCFKGYADDDGGFYSVYRKIFDQIANEDIDFLDEKEEFCLIPSFGRSGSPYERVEEFYGYWMNYSTKKSYSWLDAYDIRKGRCSKNDDHGIPSALFNAVIRNMRFPCLNRYDGCSATHPLTKMDQHEQECTGGFYECYFCSNFKGIAYDLNSHVQRYHPQKLLQHKEFWIDFSKGSQDKLYFHSERAQQFLVRYGWDTDCRKLILNVWFAGKCFKGDIFYSLWLYNIENKLLHKTKRCPCSILEGQEQNSLTVKLKSLKTPKNVLVCRFSIHQEPELVYHENICVIDDSVDSCLMKCSVQNLNEITLDESELLYPAVYYLKEIAWRVLIKRRQSLTDGKHKFGVYLQWFDGETSPVDSCRVSATFSVVTTDSKRKISRHYVKRDFSPGQNHGVFLQNWNFIMDGGNGFVKNNRIKVEIKMKIYFPTKKVLKCHHCRKDCIYCNDE